MAYPEELAERVRDAFDGHPDVRERKMFGGIVWMAHGHMAVCTLGEDLMVRLAPDEAALALAEPHVGPMEMGGRTMKGFVRVDAAGLAEDEVLQGWVDAGAGYAASLPPKS